LAFRSPENVSSRLQYLVSTIKTAIEQSNGDNPQDIVCIAHGHILSSLAMVWANIPLKDGVRLIFQTAGVAVLG
jgi:probable phosphoglycerate mutase